MQLLHFVRWLRSNTTLKFGVALKWNGPLFEEFESVAPTISLNPDHPGIRLLLRLFRTKTREAVHQAWRRSKLRVFAQRQRGNLIYANTVVVADEAKALADAGYPVLWHVHEMTFNIAFCGGTSFQRNAHCASHWIAASHPVKEALISDVRVPESEIDVVHEFIEPPIMNRTTFNVLRSSIRREMDIPENAFVVGMCGVMDWRKGADLFPLLAKHLLSRPCSRDIHVMWIGGDLEGVSALQMHHDNVRLGLAGRVHITGTKANALDYMSALDVFALTSREDPLPLAMLEAAVLALPLVCFEKSGGAVDFVQNDAGRVIDYLDISGMAEVLIELANDPQGCGKLGERARAKVLEGYTSKHQAPKLLKLMNNMIVKDAARGRQN